jgi:hypothetical protein
MNRWILAALAAWLGMGASACGVPDDEDARAPELADDGKADSVTASDGRLWRFRRDDSGRVVKARIDESDAAAAPARHYDTQAVAMAFVHKNARMLGVAADLGDVRITSIDGGVVDLQQLIAGRPLFGAELRVLIDETGRVSTIYDHAVRGVTATAITPRISAADALARVSPDVIVSTTPELGWALDHMGRPVAVWRIDDGGVRFLIDAQTGDVLDKDDSLRDASAQGTIYEENGFVTPYPTEGDLLDLASDQTLRGPNVIVLASASTTVQGHFDFATGTPGFGQVMAYHHVDHVVRWLGDRGFHPRHRAISVHTRAFRQLNAYFDPRADGIFLGATSAFDAADDADVVVHEFGHSVVHAYAPGLLGKSWSLGDASLHEGYADFLSCIYFDNPLSAAALHLALWKEGDAGDYLQKIGFDSKHPGRACNSSHINPRDVDSDPHVTGMIASGALWDVRSQVGAVTGDKLALSALAHLARSDNDFTDLLEAVLEADRRAGGHHATGIRAAFSRHGVEANTRRSRLGTLPWLP